MSNVQNILLHLGSTHFDSAPDAPIPSFKLLECIYTLYASFSCTVTQTFQLEFDAVHKTVTEL